MADATETVTFTIESDDGTSAELEVPPRLLDLLAEDGQTGPEVVGDVALFGLAQRIHAAVHHSEEDDADLETVEAVTLDLFEERFGISFAEATGHSH